MQTLNVLIAGEGKLLPIIQDSKYLKKLYIASNNEINGAINIKFNTFKELAIKCKSLQIDVVLVENEKWILQGIADVLRKNFVNCIAPTAYWAETLRDSIKSRELLVGTSINIPRKFQYPKEFPLLVRGKGFKFVAKTLNEAIALKTNINSAFPLEIAQTTFLEELLEGEVLNIVSFFDGKTLKTFSDDKNIIEYSNALQEILLCKKANFIGFFNSRLIYKDNKLYNAGFDLDISKIELNKDLLFILSLGIYQKLNEIL